MTDLLIIGAGPVGLKTAIEMKLRDPALSILMLEKYSSYRRKHTLSIDSLSFINSHFDSSYQTLLRSFVGNTSTMTLEKELKAFALSLGINIRHENVEDCQNLATRYPEVKLIIGADGAHSMVRKNIFDDKFKQQTDLQYVAEMKYAVKGKTRALSQLTEIPIALMKTNHFIVENVGKSTGQETQVTLRVFIEPSEHASLKQATYKHPYSWNSKDKKLIDSKVIDSLERWLDYRQTILNDDFQPESTRITGLKLSCYSSQKVVHEKHGATWALVGDSAFGVPYFKSLNNGFLCADVLAEQAVRHLHGEQDTEKKTYFGFQIFNKKYSPLKKYGDFVDSLSDKEILAAQIKAKCMKAADYPLSASRSVFKTASHVEKEYVFAASAAILTAYGIKQYIDFQKAKTGKPESHSIEPSNRYHSF